MYRLLLVDDEHYVVKGLRNIIDWKIYDIKVVGEAYDGSEAIDLLKKEEVDIVFLDIKMPNISGIEVLEEINKLGLNVSVVIMSGFDDFEYAKQGIRYNVFDYLLKPTRIDDIINMVSRLVIHLDENRVKQLELSNDVARNNMVLYLKQQISGAKDVEIRDDVKKKLENKRFVLSIFDIDYTSIKEKHRTESLFENLYYLYDIEIQKYFGDILTYVISNDHYKCIVIFMLQFHQSYELLVNEIADFDRLFHAKIEATSTISISKVGEDCRKLSDLYAMAMEGMTSRVLCGNGNLIVSSTQDSKTVNNLSKSTFSSADISELNGNISKDKLNEFLVKIEEEFRIKEIRDLSYIRNIYRKVVERLMALISESEVSDIAAEIDLHGKIYTPIDRYETLKDISIYVKKVLNEAIYKKNNERLYKNPKEIRYMIDYVHDNYGKNLNLDFFANELGLTNNYLSYIFRQDVGKTFGRYVMELRIEQAKKLLLETNLRVYEISNRVGYKNPHYFSKIFKKFTGVEPSNFKK